MKVEQLEEHICALALLEPNDAPVISCYLDCRGGPANCQKLVEERARTLLKPLSGPASRDFEKALAKVHRFLGTELGILTLGVAIFARAGEDPFFRSLQFEVSLPNWISADSTPNLFHLVELQDNYDRYVILLVTETSARIIGINLGSVTDLIVSTRPDLRHRSGHEWTRQHYSAHRRERTSQFIHAQIRVLASVMSAGGYAHLILAGSPRATAIARDGLPKSLATTLVDSVAASATDPIPDVIASTLQRFLEHEESDSQAVAERLVTQIYAQGLSAAGTRPTLRALKSKQADFLVIAKDYQFGWGWECRACGRIETEMPCPNTCPGCRRGSLRRFELRGELVRLAKQIGCGVEVVGHSDALIRVGGVGCLLRFLSPEHYACEAA